ncbi:MAG: MutH/Sau3AI family endonuclease [Bacteroidota bacterium]
MKEFKTQSDLVNFYNGFENKTLGELNNFIKENYPKILIRENKGVAGQILEALIGSPPNSNPSADVESLGIELKVLPLRKISNSIQPKERSKIKSINYNKIVHEEWISSEIRSKMQKILFLLYEHPTGKTFKESEEFIFKGTLLYELEKEGEETVKQDWEGIKNKVVSEIADTISEGQSKVLGACTSGTGKLIEYGNSKTAKQRSYSLKHSYLKFFYEKNNSDSKYIQLNLEPKQEPQDFILNKLNKELLGKNLKELSTLFGVDFSPKAKNSFRLLLNRILKIDDKIKILDLELNGIELKTIPVSPENKPWEAMSFPKFSLVDLIDEEWEGELNNEAVFRSIISNGYIFIPIIKEKFPVIKKNGKKGYSYNDWTEWKIGKSVYWKASEKELSTIQNEWERAKKIVEKGVEVYEIKQTGRTIQGNNLLKSTETEIIHIRPHGNDSNDIDIPFLQYTARKIRISWQSFWLNKSFTEKVIAQK